jgi:hypothetical protein
LTLVATATSRPEIATPAKPVGPSPVPRVSTNPTVEPGKVHWHASFADARDAAAKSGKPVLLFHMMGQLDKQFC